MRGRPPGGDNGMGRCVYIIVAPKVFLPAPLHIGSRIRR
jgi:hypothetical protein